MELITDPADLAVWSADQRRTGRSVGFVPTMGALHEGHIALVRQALVTCDAVVASVFVNPLQFNNPEDLRNYPRPMEQDSKLLREEGCHALFAPTSEDIYARASPRTYDLGGLDGVLEGPSRPGHFQGVVSVVERLFHYVRPDQAFFGEKDRQQLAVVRHVAAQQRWPEIIIACPIVRAPDGLALSSRNARLNPHERAIAPVLFQSLQAVAGNAFERPVAMCRQAGLDKLADQPEVKLDYLELAHPRTLLPVNDWGDLDEVSVLIAAWLGPVRLIDNLTLRRSPLGPIVDSRGKFAAPPTP